MRTSTAVGVVLGVLVGATTVVAHEDHAHPTIPVRPDEQHRATPLPDRIVLTWAGDPTTTMDVTWRTDLSEPHARVEVMRADRLRQTNAAEARVIEGATERFDSDLGSYHMHTAHLDKLEPDTMYAYRVGGPTNPSEWLQFRTASLEAKPFSFVYFGDAQNDIRSLWSRVIREANQHAPRAAFLLHAGDLVNSANADAQWGEWFAAGGWLNGMIPSVATPGNHEYSDGRTRHWAPQFSFPLNGPPGLEETVYWFDYQGARIISLNSNEQTERQADWLRSVLSDPDRPKWTFVTFHHPIFSAAKERDNAALRALWRPILEEHGVDLVLQGHDHAYARSALGGPTNVTEGVTARSSNTVYVVSVSGPKVYPLQESWEVPRVATGVQLFQVVQVSQDAIRYESRLASGDLYDAFTLTKDADGVSTLTEVDNLPAQILEQPSEE